MGNVVQPNELHALRSKLHGEKKKIVFTNGVFDIIHRGHVEYLSKAKSLGDVLVVGVNSDASVRRIKGPTRPIVKQDDRSYIVVNLVPVDYICLFDQDTPLEIITKLLPDVLVKGADWNIDEIVGKDVVEKAGGTVATIDFVPNRSTTNIIDEILKRFSEPSDRKP